MEQRFCGYQFWYRPVASTSIIQTAVAPVQYAYMCVCCASSLHVLYGCTAMSFFGWSFSRVTYRECIFAPVHVKARALHCYLLFYGVSAAAQGERCLVLGFCCQHTPHELLAYAGQIGKCLAAAPSRMAQWWSML